MNGHYGQSHYGHSPYAYHGYEDPEEMIELNAAPPGYHTHHASNSFDFQFNDVPAPAMPSPRAPVMPYRPGHVLRDEFTAPVSPWLRTPRSSAGQDSLTNTPYDSRSTSPTLVCFNSSNAVGTRLTVVVNSISIRTSTKVTSRSVPSSIHLPHQDLQRIGFAPGPLLA